MEHLVYISEYLTKIDRGGEVAIAIEQALRKNPLGKIPENKNEWCRDYMPIKASDGSFVLFKYLPSYIIGRTSYEATIPDQEKICRLMGFGAELEICEVILEGGAIEIYEDNGIMSDRVIIDNCSRWHNNTPDVLKIIQDRLKLKSLTVVPSDPWDFTGHVDGLVRFIDDKRVLVNDLNGLETNMEHYSKYEQEKFQIWKSNFENTLTDAGFLMEKLPCAVQDNSNLIDATGIYLNFLLFDDLILMPSYTDLPQSNKDAHNKLELYYKKKVVDIFADSIAKRGGVINCVTWAK